MHEYLWAEECRVVTLTSLSYNSDDIKSISIPSLNRSNQQPITLNANSNSKLTVQYHES